MLPEDWIPHRRGDGETVGWIAPDGEDFAAYDLLGRRVAGPTDWVAAEEALEELGIGYLSDPWWLAGDAGDRPVRIGEATPERITVVADDFGSASVVGADPETFVLPFPAPDILRPR